MKLHIGHPAHAESNAALFGQNGANYVLPGDEFLTFPWPLEDNSVSSVHIFFKLETLVDERQFLRFMRELHRVCCDGAYIDVSANTSYYLEHLQLPFATHALTERSFALFDDTKERKDDFFKDMAAAYDDCTFRLLRTNANFSTAVTEHINSQKFASAEELQKYVLEHPELISYFTFSLVAVKDKSHTFGLAQLPGGTPFVLRLAPQDTMLSDKILTEGYWEVKETLLASKVLGFLARHAAAEGRELHMANLGANLGWYSVIAPHVASNVSVEAFEPSPEMFELLQQNIAQNELQEKVHANALAVSDKAGEVSFFVDENNAGASLMIHKDGAEEHEIKVQATSLDQFYGDKDQSTWPEFIIMDVEGHDQKVFEGSRGLLEKGWRPVMMAEFSPYLLALEGTCDYFKHMIEDYGYKIFKLNMDVPAETAATLIVSDAEDLQNVFEALKDDNREVYANLLLIPEGSVAVELLPEEYR